MIGRDIIDAMKNGIQKVVLANEEIVIQVLVDSGMAADRKNAERVAGTLMTSALIELIGERNQT